MAVAGRRKGKKDFIAPMVLTRSLNAEGFEGWLSLYLGFAEKVLGWGQAVGRGQEAGGKSTTFMLGGANFGIGTDLNDIEHDFSALKRARMYAPLGTPLDEIIRTYCLA